MTPAAVAERYFACMHGRDLDALIALFSDDAVFTMPDGLAFAGAGAIRQMYAGLFASNRPAPNPVRTIVSDKSIAVEIEGKLADGAQVNTANFFYLNAAGAIQNINVYRRA